MKNKSAVKSNDCGCKALRKKLSVSVMFIHVYDYNTISVHKSESFFILSAC